MSDKPDSRPPPLFKLSTVLACAIIGALVCVAYFRTRITPEPKDEVQILRTRAEIVAIEMAAAARDYRHLEEEVRALRPATRRLMEDEGVRNSEWPELWWKVSRGADPEMVAEFHTLAGLVKVPWRDLATGGDPHELGGILEEARKKAEWLNDETRRRRAALLQLEETMKRERLIHDAAWSIATTLMEAIGQVLEEEKEKDVFGVLYTTVRAGIEEYETRRERLEERIHPR